MTPEQAHASPFEYLDLSLWRRTKTAHTTLTIVGFLLLLPAAGVFLALWEWVSSAHSFFDDEILLALGSALVGSISGCVAWCALCLLYFKRSDLRWQRIAWSTCAGFGYLTTPCVIGWILWMMSEQGPAVAILILLGILIVSITCAGLGTNYARLATSSLSSKPHPSSSGTVDFNEQRVKSD